MKHSAETIANYLILKASEDDGGELLSNLKLQKLLYYSQAFFYAKYETPLFSEKIEAWHYGPVVPEIYRKYKQCGSGSISVKDISNKFNFTNEQKEMIDEVFEYFGQFSASKLVTITHAEPPWLNASSSDKKEITLTAMRNYYKTQLS